jgi:hypothetical protein
MQKILQYIIEELLGASVTFSLSFTVNKHIGGGHNSWHSKLILLNLHSDAFVIQRGA